jgi:lysozyme
MTDIKRILFFLLGVSILYKVTRKIGGKMNITNAMSDLVKQFEGLKLNAYLDIADVWTIGYGLTRYPNGTKVKPGDKITKEQADSYFNQTLQKFAQEVEDMIKSKINNNQFAALVSFAYNFGSTALKNSTLLKLVNQNPNNPLIRDEFNKWVYAKGKVSKGLQRRRELEANLYFS